MSVETGNPARTMEWRTRVASYLSATVTGMAQETWATRDLPVLQAIVEIADEDHPRHIYPKQIAQRTGLPGDAVKLALFALADDDPPFFSYTDGSTMAGRDIVTIRSPTGRARRTVGTWPSPEALADRLLEALAQAADHEPDEEKKGKLRRAATSLGSMGRDVFVEVVAAAISRGGGFS